MAYRVELTRRAGRDLACIYRYIQAEDSAAAAVWFNGLEAAVYTLEEHPNRSAITPNVHPDAHAAYLRGLYY